MKIFHGSNLLPEGLEIGEPIKNVSSAINGLGICYVIAYSRDPAQDNLGASGSNYNGCIVNGIASGLWYYISNMNNCLTMLQTISNAGFADSVVAVYSIPTIAILGWDPTYSIEELDDRYQVWGFWVNNQFESNGREINFNSTPSTLNGYTPRNQKLRTYPYCYLGYEPSNGSRNIFRYEDFTNGTPSFSMRSEINPNPTVFFIPKNYKGDNLNVTESATLNGYPTISYHTDFFNSWLAQNSGIVSLNMQQEQFNYQLGIAKDSVNYVGNSINNALSMNIGQFVNDSANVLLNTYGDSVNHDFYVQRQMAQIEKQSMLSNPSSMGSGNTTLLGYDLQKEDVFTRYTIKSQFAERIDLFFDMYGYLTNKLKVPNLYNRPNWNYVKTIGANITGHGATGNVPQTELQIIRNMFDNGVTLWHNPATFLDYSQNNR